MNQSVNFRSIQTQIKSRLFAILCTTLLVTWKKTQKTQNLLHKTSKERDYKMNQTVNFRSIQTQIKSRLFAI